MTFEECLEKLEQYREVGTVEEFREVMKEKRYREENEKKFYGDYLSAIECRSITLEIVPEKG